MLHASNLSPVAGLLSCAIAALLLVAALRDMATRLIPDFIPVGLAICGVLERVVVGWSAVGFALLAGAALIPFLLLAHARGALGGGDVKLIVALAFGFAPAELWRFVEVMAISGGVLAAIHLVLRRVWRNTGPFSPPPPGVSLARRILRAEHWRIARRGPLPYGVAIACGGLGALWTRVPW